MKRWSTMARLYEVLSWVWAVTSLAYLVVFLPTIPWPWVLVLVACSGCFAWLGADIRLRRRWFAALRNEALEVLLREQPHEPTESMIRRKMEELAPQKGPMP